MTRVKAVLDNCLEKLISRKLLAWATATWLMYNNAITSEDWTACTLVYIGSQMAVDLAAKWKHGK